METLLRDARVLDEAQFTARHGEAFLVHLPIVGAPARAQPRAATDNPFDEVATTLNDPSDDAAGELGLLVLSIRRKPTSQFDFVSIGRHPNNDVVVPDGSVSKFHALIKRDAAGQFALFDGGSTNGSAVDGEVAPTTKDRRKPLPLGAGCNVRIGHCEFTFLLAAELCQWVRSGRLAI